jgi:dihydroorotate dehydrogenase/NAD-dependent dihydropyrimidine dehydrogenase PreA subunit
MADLTTRFLGIQSPNPFWLASAPPTDKAYNVNRAFEAGWGGAVWKTLGEDPPIVNVSGPRYGAIHSNDRRVIGFNNIELITDRPLQANLDEIRQIKRDWPDRALLVSVMLPMNEATWAKFVPMIEDTGADGFELNFGCPHGMSERGMGSHGGYCGPAVKPIALHMVAEIARHAETKRLPISGIGGITDWRDAVDFLALGASNVQVCTAAMVYGFKIIDDLTDGLGNFLDEKGMRTVAELVGRAVPSVTDWQYLNLNHVEKAVIDQDLCIRCGRCHIVCEDASHQAITKTVNGERHFEVIDEECVGCNLCVSVCPVDGCITMQPLTSGVDPRTGRPILQEKANWTTHPNNPLRKS